MALSSEPKSVSCIASQKAEARQDQPDQMMKANGREWSSCKGSLEDAQIPLCVRKQLKISTKTFVRTGAS